MSFQSPLNLASASKLCCSRTDLTRSYVEPGRSTLGFFPFSASSIFGRFLPEVPPSGRTPSGFGYLPRCRGRRCRHSRLRCIYGHFPARNASGIKGFSGFPRARPNEPLPAPASLMLFTWFSRSWAQESVVPVTGVTERSCRFYDFNVFRLTEPAVSPLRVSRSTALTLGPASGLSAFARSFAQSRGVSPSTGQVRSCLFVLLGDSPPQALPGLSTFMPLRASLRCLPCGYWRSCALGFRSPAELAFFCFQNAALFRIFCLVPGH